MSRKKAKPQFKLSQTLMTTRYLPPLPVASVVIVLEIAKLGPDFRYRVQDIVSGQGAWAYEEDLELPLVSVQ